MPVRLVVAVGIALVAPLAVWLVVGAPAAGTAADFIQLGTMGLMGGAGLYAAAKASETRARAGWLLIGATGVCWLFGQVLWVLLLHRGVGAASDAYVYTLQVAYLVGTPMLVLGAANLLGRNLTVSALYRRLVDAAATVASILVVLWLVYLGDAYRASPDHWPFTLAFAFVYPVGDAILISLLLALYLHMSPADRRWHWPLAVGFLCIVAADVVFTFTQANGDYDSASRYILGWATGEVLLAFAAVRSATAAPQPRQPLPRASYSRWPLLPPVVATAAVALSFASAGGIEPFVVYGMLATLLALVLSHLLHIREMEQGAAALRRVLEAERDLEASRRELEEARRMGAFKTQLLNLASHELNTPISALRLQLHMFRLRLDGKVDDATQEGLRLLERNVERLGALVADTLDVARIQSGRFTVAPVPTAIAPLVDEAVATFCGLAGERNVRVGSEVASGLEAQVDPRRFTQVLFNLVSNAIKFTPVGGEVRIAAEARDGQMRLEVRDSGIGMTPEQMSRLFVPFSQVHDPENAATKGTGLGLFISRGIVEQHGGRLVASSPGPGQGSRFRVDVPLAPLSGAPGVAA